MYRNSLKLHATQLLPRDTEIKVKDYLKNHLTNFKPHNPNTQILIEEIKTQNAKLIKESAKSFGELNSKYSRRSLRNYELIELKKKERCNKEKFNFTILTNLNYETKMFINLDVQYDFIPCNEEYLRRMRLDFISK